MNRITFLCLLIGSLSCDSQNTRQRTLELEKIAFERRKELSNNFKYKVLVDAGQLIDFELLESRLHKHINSRNLKILNKEFTALADSLKIIIPIIRGDKLLEDVYLSKILVADELISRTLNSTTSFSMISPEVIVEDENDSIVFYKIALHAHDELFGPKVFLNLSTGEFPIFVDELTGFARFEMRKKDKMERKSFTGRIVYQNFLDEEKIVEFEYPK